MALRRMRDRATGAIVWVDEATGRPVQVADAEPGFPTTAAQREMMSRLPDADLAGAIGPGVVPGGEQGLGARRGNRDQLNQPPPPNTYRPLAGMTQNMRGQTKVLEWTTAGTGILDQRFGIPALVQTPRDCGDDAEILSVILGMEIQAPEVSNPIRQGAGIIALARIEWGIGGASFSANVDWQQGTILSVPASSLKVTCEAVCSFDPIHPPTPASPFKVAFSAALAYGLPGSYGGSSPARLTDNQATGLGAGMASALFEIPQWATSFNLISQNAGGAPPDFTVTMFRAPGDPMGDYRVVSDSDLGNRNEHSFPVPNMARFYQVTNNSVANNTVMAMIWNIGIG